MGDVIEVPPDPNTQNWDSHGVPLQSTAILITDVPKWNQSCKPEPLHVCIETMPGMPLGSTAVLISDVPHWNQSGTEAEPNEIARSLKRIACFWR